MKCVEADKLQQLPGRQVTDGERFAFRCHAGLSCFNRCCRNLNLFLYPYDVVRLKARLGLDATRFLERHADIVLRPGGHFPDVLLRMAENPERTCPFLSDAGCAVYPDRPDTCRTFPIEQGALYDASTGRARAVHFFRPPDFCLGQHEAQTWTPKAWEADQQAVVYHRMTWRWAEVRRLFENDPWGAEGPGGARGRMAFTAAYNMDAFREFVFGSSFLKRYKVKAETIEASRKDDTALLGLGLAWIRWFVWGLPTRTLRPR